MTNGFKGRLEGVSRDFETNNVKLTIEAVEGLNPGALSGLKGKDLRVIIKPWRATRGLDANAYYWVLIGKLAEALHNSRAETHNLVMWRYGEDLVIDGRTVYIVLPDTETAQKKALQAETYHIRPTSQVKEGKDGKMYRTWVMLIGSHEMDTKQFSRLLDGLIDECKHAGIETATPEQIERMKQLYEQHHQ